MSDESCGTSASAWNRGTPLISSVQKKKCIPSGPRLSCVNKHEFFSINQSINQSIKIYIAPLQDTYSDALPTHAKRKRSLEKVVELQAPFGRCLLDLQKIHSRFLDQPQKMNEFALSQRGRMGPRNYREQRTGVYDGLH